MYSIRGVGTKTLFQLPPIILLSMPSDVMISISTTVCYFASQIVSCYSYTTHLLLYTCTATFSLSRLLSIFLEQGTFSARLGPASLHQKTKAHKPVAHNSSVIICVWSAQVPPFVIPQLGTGMGASTSMSGNFVSALRVSGGVSG